MTKTHADYRRYQHRQNAAVFVDIWDDIIVGVDDEGILCATDGSAAVLTFLDIVAAIQRTDKLHKLTRADAIEAAAMVYHLVPKLQEG